MNISDTKTMGWRKVPLWIAILLTLLLIGANMVIFPHVPVTHDKPVEKFWAMLTHEDPELIFMNQGLIVLDDYCYLSQMHLHGGWIWRVPKAELEARLDELLTTSRQEMLAGDKTVLPYVSKAIDCYEKEPPRGETRLDRFEQCLTHAKIEYWIAQRPQTLWYAGSTHEREMIRIHRARYLWYQLVFEILWLSGLAWLALWPAIRGASIWRWGLHLFFVPILFMTPAYMGYQIYLYTSVGPQGGALYTFLLRFTRRGYSNPWDQWILNHRPDLFGGLNADPGAIVSISGSGIWGPTSCLIAGAVLAALVMVIHWRGRRYNGFPLSRKPQP